MEGPRPVGEALKYFSNPNSTESLIRVDFTSTSHVQSLGNNCIWASVTRAPSTCHWRNVIEPRTSIVRLSLEGILSVVSTFHIERSRRVVNTELKSSSAEILHWNSRLNA